MSESTTVCPSTTRTTSPDHAAVIAALRAGMAPATGCTEPIALAYAAARAAAELGEPVVRIEACASPNVVKNAMAVVVPGTGVPGLEIAAAIGAVDGDPGAGLAVLAHVSDEGVARAHAMVREGRVTVSVADVTDELFAQATLFSEHHMVTVGIAGHHTNIYRISKDGDVLLETPRPAPHQARDSDELLRSLTLRQVFDVATTAPLDDLRFVLEAEVLNSALVEAGLSGTYGLGVGVSMVRSMERGLTADDLTSRMVSRTAAASDARMGGATLPAMTNAGSGNQGITATVPVTVAADMLQVDQETRIRALALSHLTALHVHAHLPVLSAFCATTTAAMGAAAGVCLVLDGRYVTVERAVSSMAGDLVGMVCDGAGCSCTMKVASAVGSAARAAILALEDRRVPGTEGMVSESVDDTIDNVARLVHEGMTQTDPTVLKIMLSKPQS